MGSEYEQELIRLKALTEVPDYADGATKKAYARFADRVNAIAEYHEAVSADDNIWISLLHIIETDLRCWNDQQIGRIE